MTKDGRDCARPEGAAAPSLMLEYQKSRRRRSALVPGCPATIGVWIQNTELSRHHAYDYD